MSKYILSKQSFLEILQTQIDLFFFRIDDHLTSKLSGHGFSVAILSFIHVSSTLGVPSGFLEI